MFDDMNSLVTKVSQIYRDYDKDRDDMLDAEEAKRYLVEQEKLGEG